MERDNFRRSEFLYRRARGLLERFPANAKLIGEENIDLIRNLLNDGWIITAAGDHKSLADMYTVYSAAIKYKFSDLPENGNIVMGVKWTRKFPTSLITKVLRVIETVPNSVPAAKFPDRDEINQRAFDAHHNSPPGKLWMVTPEGTRSDGKMEQGRQRTIEFWHGEGGATDGRILLPVAVEGTERQWPKGKGFMYFLRKGRHEEALFIFGKPIKVADIDQVASELAEGNEKLFKQYQIDVVMALIASQHVSDIYTEKFKELVTTIRDQSLFQSESL